MSVGAPVPVVHDAGQDPDRLPFADRGLQVTRETFLLSVKAPRASIPMMTCRRVVMCRQQNPGPRNFTFGITIRRRRLIGSDIQKGHLTGPPNGSTADRRARLAARFVADTRCQEIAEAETAVVQARLGRGDLDAAIARLGRTRSALADALAMLD